MLIIDNITQNTLKTISFYHRPLPIPIYHAPTVNISNFFDIIHKLRNCPIRFNQSRQFIPNERSAEVHIFCTLNC